MTRRIATGLTLAASLVILLPASAARSDGRSSKTPFAQRVTVTVTQIDAGLSQDLSPQPAVSLSSTQPQGVPVIPVNSSVRYRLH